jgi:hypothetical protein
MFSEDLAATLTADLDDPVVVVGEIDNEFADRPASERATSFSGRVLAVATMKVSSSVVI